MEKKPHEFDYFKPNQELKDKTKERILSSTPITVVKRPRPMLKAAIAACLTLVIVGGSTTAFFLSDGFQDQENALTQSENNTNTTSSDLTVSQPTEGIFADDTADSGVEKDDALNGLPNDAASDFGIIVEEEFQSEMNGAGADGDHMIMYSTTTNDIKPNGKPTTGGSTASRVTASKSAAPVSKPAAVASNSIVSYATDGSASKNPVAGTLTAKMWNDNLNFRDWIFLSQQDIFSKYKQKWGITLTQRFTVTVKSGNTLLPGATVVLYNSDGDVIWSAVSDNAGKAYLFFHVFQSDKNPARITVSYRGKTLETDISNRQTTSFTAYFNQENRLGTALDLMFVCDTTGSMGDELQYLQAELENIILRVKKQNGNIPLRLSVNFYRDEGDAYVLRPFPFTTNINQSLNNLKQQYAAQGGDFEEAVDQALNDAIHNHQWSDTATAKLLFLVLDAPPHTEDKAEIQQLLADAAKKGIRVIPVTASGIDKNTEYLMRAFSVGTGGTYVALTDDSGVGNGHIAPSTGETDVHKLNDLLVRIINSYLQ